MKKFLDLLQKEAAGDYELIRALKLVAVDRNKYELAAAIREYERETFPDEFLNMQKSIDEKMDRTQEEEKPERRIVIEMRKSKDNPKISLVRMESEGFTNTAEIVGVLEEAKFDMIKNH
jgi:hypothetical protein